MFMLSDLSSFPGCIIVPLRLRVGHVVDPAYAKATRLGQFGYGAQGVVFLMTKRTLLPFALVPD